MAALLLFDIDGTLLSGKAGRRAFARVFADLTGDPLATDGIRFAGKTDLAIFREIMSRNGLRDLRAEDVVPVYLRALAEEVRHDPGRLYPGVPDLLAALLHESGFYLALGTGNLEAGARLKLEPHGISQYFPTGGFADDSAVREELIAAGIRKAERHYGTRFDRVVVIGDTPLDVGSGRANGAATLAVAQGFYGEDELRAAGADRVLPNFQDLGATLDALRALAR